MPCDHITPVIHHSTYSTTPPHYMPHCISHHTSFHTTPPHLTLHHHIWHHTITHHTGYALNCILHVTIPHHHIALSHIAHHSCISHHTTSYYAFELHHSASCAIPHHSAVYSTSRHTTLFPYCIITPHSTTQHIAPPHLVAQHSTPHLHILHYTYCSTSHHIWHHTLHLIPHHSPFHITTYCTLQLHYISRSHIPHGTTSHHNIPHCITHHFTSHHMTIPQHISYQFCTTSNITQWHHKCHNIPHRTPSKYCTSQLNSTPHRCIPHHTTTCMVTCIAPHSTSHHMHPITNTSTSSTPTSHHVSYYTNTPHIVPPHCTTTSCRTTFHSRLPHLAIRSSFHITPTHSTSHHIWCHKVTHYS